MSEVGLNLMSFNLCWTTSKDGRQGQAEAVSRAAAELGEGPILLALQEVKPASLERFKNAGWDVLASTRAPKGRLGVAILSRGVGQSGEALQLDREWFEAGEIYPELADWFVERSVAVDVMLGSMSLRFGSFHATPGSSNGPSGRGVGGARKPWFHRRIADWVATWPTPYAFAIDANSPHSETIDSVRYFVARGERCEAGEDDLLGIRELGNAPRHDADDLLRTWLASAHGAARMAAMAPDTPGPLWISHYTRGGKAKRFDHLWATAELEPRIVRYWPIRNPLEKGSISDHALVGARVVIAA